MSTGVLLMQASTRLVDSYSADPGVQFVSSLTCVMQMV